MYELNSHRSFSKRQARVEWARVEWARVNWARVEWARVEWAPKMAIFYFLAFSLRYTYWFQLTPFTL